MIYKGTKENKRSTNKKKLGQPYCGLSLPGHEDISGLFFFRRQKGVSQASPLFTAISYRILEIGQDRPGPFYKKEFKFNLEKFCKNLDL